MTPVDVSQAPGLASPALQLGLLFVSGMLYCFVGYRVFKLMLVLTGFLLAGGVSAAIVSAGFPDNLAVPAAIGIICGVLGAGVLLFLYRLGVFVVGAAFGALLSFQLLQMQQAAWVGLAIVLSGLLAGGLALFLERPVLSFAMAVVGAWLMVSCAAVVLFSGGALKLDPDDVSPSAAWLLLLAWMVLTVFGLMTQYGRKKKPEPRAAR
jgi:hypothetical protein